MKLYCFYDRVSGSYNRYFVAVNEDDAKRIARATLESFPFRDDLDLFLVAKIDEHLGCCLPAVSDDYNIVFLCHVSDLFQGVQNVQE
ncbi:nonstructural protein [Dipodfec virus UOA04_Rod_1056]|nr:nonstructural protein [Dipodfec virus UOA04_Rod_1056]